LRRAGQSGQDLWDKTGQIVQDSQNIRGKKGQQGQDRWEQDSLDSTARTGNVGDDL
jgi:hypothetical protein